MNLLVTGGHGFVMSNFVRHWLERYADSRVTILDATPADDECAGFLRAVQDRIHCVQTDILDLDGWSARIAHLDIDAIVHGATVTPHPYVTSSGEARDPERLAPTKVLDVNISGTVAALEFARHRGGIKRFVYVSTGSVYGDSGPAEQGQPLPEDGYVAPQTLYGISKYSAEMIARRYGELYGLSVVSARLSSVYGPMDRPNNVRNVQGTPNLVASLAVAGKPLLVHSFDGVGDWIHTADVAEALRILVVAEGVNHRTYNVAYGSAETVRDLVGHVAAVLPVSATETDLAAANVKCDPDRRAGQWGAYDINRMRTEFGWAPAPLRQRIQEYVNWLRERALSAPNL
ncbi:NAD-dependent epimerase/dehydratase family protein [Ensifer sp. 4252]|uniref:NAD-dependent epimerase/dehydratase family protein n=1 Tax=Ensifer sp. 4252 TaxID=3373915 RepID=UPI003D204A97